MLLVVVVGEEKTQQKMDGSTKTGNCFGNRSLVILSEIFFGFFFDCLFVVLLLVFGCFFVWSFFRHAEVTCFYFPINKASDFLFSRGVFVETYIANIFPRLQIKSAPRRSQKICLEQTSVNNHLLAV